MQVSVGDYIKRRKDGVIMRVTNDEESTLYADNYRIGVTDANFYLKNDAVIKTEIEKVTLDYLKKHYKEWELAVIVFDEETLKKEKTVEYRSFLVSSSEKFFNPNMIGSSLYATSLETNYANDIVRIDNLVYSGIIEYCYVMKWKPFNKRLPIVLKRYKEAELTQEETEKQILNIVKEQTDHNKDFICWSCGEYYDPFSKKANVKERYCGSC